MFEVENVRPTLKIATFSHGKLKKKKHKKIKFLSYEQQPLLIKKKNRILVGKTDSICYVGDNFNSESSDCSEMYNHYIGILNKTTGKMQICDVEIFTLHPKFPEIKQEIDDASESLNLSFIEQKLKLTNAFGSVASRRQIDNYKKTIVDGTMLDEAMDGVLEQTLNNEELTAKEEYTSESLLPPCNVDATSPNDVYNISDIISPAEMGCLYEYSQDIINFKPEDMEHLNKDNTYCLLVLDHLLSLPPLGNPERETKACYLQYLQYMVMFQKLSKPTIRSKSFYTHFPPIVSKEFISKFLLLVRNPKGIIERQTCESLKDKLAIYILILLLIIDDFSVSFEKVQKGLNFKAKKLQLLFNYIGCEIQKKKLQGTVHKFAVLKIPLKLMKSHKSSKRN